jgi:hypothetical protein
MDLEFKIEVQNQDIYQTTNEKLGYKIIVKGVSPAHINTFIDELFARMDKMLPGTVTIEENNDFVN